MKQVKEYDLAYICYYSERIALSTLGLGFEPRFSVTFLTDLIRKLKNENKFYYYKNMYVNLLND
ncbi:hypothetical protein IKE_05689 [Bacillus cereus VD196]|uniref:Uncharacterized protein n=1 Tax=Bacillus cereus VD196 TaxID=1053243 RepID=A0A9W5V661_BACCE|nr:hypothetical protein IKG_05856 [Bacillus cereus VD200]EOO62460.1 hypothetical protein IKE_05689 [Bacillus cereus VD196]